MDEWVVFNKCGVRVSVVGVDFDASVVVVVDTELLNDTELLVPGTVNASVVVDAAVVIM